MRVLALLWILGFLLEEVQAWGFRNGIFHNSIWLGKKKKCLLVVAARNVGTLLEAGHQLQIQKALSAKLVCLLFTKTSAVFSFLACDQLPVFIRTFFLCLCAANVIFTKRLIVRKINRPSSSPAASIVPNCMFMA